MVSHKRSLDQNEKEGDCSNKTIPIATATEEVLVKKRRDGGEANIEEDDLFHALDHQNMLTCQMYDTVSEEEQIVNDSNKVRIACFCLIFLLLSCTINSSCSTFP